MIQKTELNDKRYFITLLLIFTFSSSFQIFLLSPDLKSPDLGTYALVVAALLFSVKAFVGSYANIVYAISKKRWAVAAIDTLFTLVQFFAIFQAIFALTQNSFPQDTFLWFVVIEIAYNLQILLGKLSNMLKVTFWSIFYYTAGYFCLNFRVFGADPRFISGISIIALAFVLVQYFLIFRAVTKSEIIKT